MRMIKGVIQTKKMIKDTFWEILEEKPYNKITVQDIVNRCHVNRNTYYYHFQDIPTLMTDSIEDWMMDVIQKYGTLESPVDCLTYMAQECMKRKKAFLHLFRSVQKDVFLSGLSKMGDDIIRSYVEKLGKYERVSKAEKEILIKCYKCVFIGSILDWLEEGASYNLEELYEEMCKMFAGSGKRVLSAYKE